jgi:hypothetical protein
MSTDTTSNHTPASTRRSFLKGGVLLAVPLAAAAPGTFMADDGLKARLARLEDEIAIRELHQAWLRRVKSGSCEGAKKWFARPPVTMFDQSVCSITPDHAGEADVIEVAPDGKSASGRFYCAVEKESAIAQDCTLAQMAHLQGGGFVRRTDHRVLVIQYAKEGGAWVIAKVEFALV